MYRGKYPNRIKSVSSVRGQGALVETNRGDKFRVFPITREGSNHMPTTRDDIHGLSASGWYRFERA